MKTLAALNKSLDYPTRDFGSDTRCEFFMAHRRAAKLLVLRRASDRFHLQSVSLQMSGHCCLSAIHEFQKSVFIALQLVNFVLNNQHNIVTMVNGIKSPTILRPRLWQQDTLAMCATHRPGKCDLGCLGPGWPNGGSKAQGGDTRNGSNSTNY